MIQSYPRHHLFAHRTILDTLLSLGRPTVSLRQVDTQDTDTVDTDLLDMDTLGMDPLMAVVTVHHLAIPPLALDILHRHHRLCHPMILVTLVE